MNNHEEYSVAKWAAFFQVSRSGYYTHISLREQREEEEKAQQGVIANIFHGSGATYGPERICGILRKSGRKASYGKVSRLMAIMGMSSIYNRHKRRSLTDSRKSRGEGFNNLVRGQTFSKPHQTVCSDITYLKSDEGWLYLCTIKDILGGEILGEATSKHLKSELVVRAFLNAQARHALKRGSVFHSDRGSQYTSAEFMEILRLYGIRQSFSRVGMPGDNAWSESFFATLKKECIHGNHFATREELRETVFSWIESFYNNRRVQARLGYRSPREYTALLMEAAKMEQSSSQPSNNLVHALA